MDPQSFFDVDHYRPKLEAKRSETDTDTPGYEWLAFSWDNFRYAANCSNRLRENTETGCVEGKGSWFPLLEGSVKASWENRCEAEERPVLLDPNEQTDADLVDVGSDGRVGASRIALGTAKLRVKRSCELYGLNLPGVKGARLRLMREIQGMLQVLVDSIAVGNEDNMPDEAADKIPIKKQRDLIRAKTLPESPYSKTVRAEIIRAGWADILPKPEEFDELRAA
jgi:hypothetical protein